MRTILPLRKMPETCKECPCFREDDYTCKATGRNAMITKRPYSCKIMEISEARYINVDKLITELEAELATHDIYFYTSCAEKEARDEKIQFTIEVLKEAAELNDTYY